MTHEHVIIIGPTVRLSRAKRKQTPKGDIVYTKHKAWWSMPGTGRPREHWLGKIHPHYRCIYHIVSETGASTLMVDAASLRTHEYSPGEFHGAIESRIADRVLHSGFDWKLIALLVIGAIAIIAVLR